MAGVYAMTPMRAVLAAMLALLGAVLATAPAHSAGLEDPCVIDVVVSPDLLADTRVAAKRWNAHTTTLEEWPYRLRVRAGNVRLRDGVLSSSGDITGISVTGKQLRDLEETRGVPEAGAGVDYLAHGGWAIDGFTGFAINLDALDSRRQRRLVIGHELGHAIGVTHTARPGYVMSEYVEEQTRRISTPSTWDVRTKAETNHYLFCWQP